MRIAVLVKQVPDTWGERRLDRATGRVDRTRDEQVIDEIDERALEAALAHRDGDKGTEVVAVVMGPPAAAAAVKKALSIGADSGIHIVDDALAGADAGRTAAALAAAVRGGGFDLVLAGNISTDGRGGVVPAMVSEHLGVPALTSLDDLQLTGGTVRGTRTGEYGRQRLQASLPALVTVSERLPEARFPTFKTIMGARKKKVTTLTAAQLGLPAPGQSATSVVVSTAQRPPRAGGTVVADDGSAAGRLVEFLATRQLA